MAVVFGWPPNSKEEEENIFEFEEFVDVSRYVQPARLKSEIVAVDASKTKD